MFKIGQTIDSNSPDYQDAAMWCNDNGATIKKDGDAYVICDIEGKTSTDKIKAQIEAIEASITIRDLLRAIIGADGGHLENLYAQITELEKNLK